MRGDQLGEPSTLAEALDRVTRARRREPWKNPHAGRVDPGTKTERRAKNKRARKARRR